ncbi:MAG: DUF4838 domain-containing protein [Victivallales bacterium]|nr:DUF4838 domain-containing protein [Victivallales bacterium]
MKRIFFPLVPLLLLCAAMPISASSYHLVRPDSPQPWEETAVEELRVYLGKRVSGALSVNGMSGIAFHVGDTALAKAKHLASAELEDEQWVIRSFGKDVILNGGGTHGCLYAVYHFLEDFCDIHWWGDTEEYVPTAAPLALPSLNVRGRPHFRYRNIVRASDLGYGEAGTRFLLRNRLNCEDLRKIPMKFGGSLDYGRPGHAHTFEAYISPKEYGKTNPLYFSLKNGHRLTGEMEGQLCLSNRELRPIFVRKLLDNIAADRAEAARTGTRPPLLYDLSQNDNNNPCECGACRAAAEKYGQSGALLRFLNEITAEVTEKYPDIYITTLAYHYTEPLPKGGVKAHPRLIIKLTNTKTNKSASLLEPQNAFFKEAVEQWSGICDNLIIWEYAITFNKNVIGMPFASEKYYGDQYGHYARNKVMGVFVEHQFPERADMFELKFFLECKLLEDPLQNVQALTDLFLEKYYGCAARHIREYRRIVDEAARKANAQVRWLRNLSTFDFLDEETILQCQKLFDDAVAEAKDDSVLVARLMRARNGLDRLTCLRTTSLIRHGIKGPQKTSRLDGHAAFRRLESHWPAWCNRYPGHESWKNPISDVLDFFRWFYFPPAVPRAFEDKGYYDFVAVCSARGDYDFRNVRAVNDQESDVRRAFRIHVNGDRGHYDMPFAFGLYDGDKQQTLARSSITRIPDYPGYNWFRLESPVVIPPNGLLFINRAWTIQLHLADYPELVGKSFVVWVSAKHQGKQFHPWQNTEDENIFIDRILLVEP